MDWSELETIEEKTRRRIISQLMDMTALEELYKGTDNYDEQTYGAKLMMIFVSIVCVSLTALVLFLTREDDVSIGCIIHHV